MNTSFDVNFITCLEVPRYFAILRPGLGLKFHGGWPISDLRRIDMLRKKKIHCFMFSIISVGILLFLTYGEAMFSVEKLAQAFSQKDWKSTVLLLALVAEAGVLILFGMQDLDKTCFFAGIVSAILAGWPFYLNSELVDGYFKNHPEMQNDIVLGVAIVAIGFAILLKYIAVRPYESLMNGSKHENLASAVSSKIYG